MQLQQNRRQQEEYRQKLRAAQLENTKSQYEIEHNRREQIKSQMQMAIAAMSFTMFGYGILASNFEGHIRNYFDLMTSSALVGAAFLGVFFFVRAMMNIVNRDNWQEIDAPPNWSEMGIFEDDLRASLDKGIGPAATELAVLERTTLVYIEAYGTSRERLRHANGALLRRKRKAITSAAFAMIALLFCLILLGIQRNDTNLRSNCDIMDTCWVFDKRFHPEMRWVPRVYE